MEQRADVLVVGGGVIGLTCAWRLLLAGRSVHLIEAERIGAGASSGNCGLITPSHALPLTRPKMVRQALRSMFKQDAPLRVAPRFDLGFLGWGIRFAARCSKVGMLDAMRGRGVLLERSRDLYYSWTQGGLDCEWDAGGVFEVFLTEKAMAHSREAARILDEQGIESFELDGEAMRKREPALLEAVIGGREFPRDAELRPEALLESLAAKVREAGGTIEEGVKVEAVEEGAAVTSRGRREAGQVVVATGALAPKLLPRLMIQPGKGYSITMERPEICPEVPLLLAEANMAVTPWASGLRLGGTMEFAGYDDSHNSARVEALRRGASEYLTSIDGAHPEEWWGWRPMTPDELPILDKVKGVIVAVGHGMMGVSMAPATAEVVVSLAGAGPCDIDLKPFRADRF